MSIHPLKQPRQFKTNDLEVWIIPMRQDNYTYFVSRPGQSTGWIVDPSEDTPLIAFLKSQNLTPTHVLLTHHHEDHIKGAEALREMYGAKLVGATSERARLPKLDIEFKDSDRVELSSFEIQIVACPGHTFHHVSLFLEKERALFCGDVMFGLGCGRVFEGTMREMHETLMGLTKLSTPSADVSVFCGHEYTRANLNVWKTLDILKPNEAIVTRLDSSDDLCTIPLSLNEEKKWNPLLTENFEQFKKLRETRNDF